MATSRQGRVRLRNEAQAQLMWDILWDYYGAVINLRWKRKSMRLDYSEQQQLLTQINLLKDELLRTAEEMGWTLDVKSVGTDQGAAGAAPAAAEPEPVGRWSAFSERESRRE